MDTSAGEVGRNWSGNIAYSAQRLVAPSSVDELAALVLDEPRLRVLGSRHSFNDLADTPGTLVSLAALAATTPVRRVDDSTVAVPAGIRYGDLVPTLSQWGVALSNLASLPHISVGGAVQTGTHGSGDNIGSLATQVSAVELITGAGEHLRLRRGDEDFDGAVVGLGALGVVTRLELDVEETFDVAQTVWEGAHWDDVLANLDAVTSAGLSVSNFTTWRSADAVDQIWVKSRVGESTEEGEQVLRDLGAHPADGPRHPLPGMDWASCTEQLGVPGPWFERLAHFRLDFTPSAGDELQSEYLVPRADAVEAISAMRPLAAQIQALMINCEIRTMAADNLWLSPAYGAPTVGIHFTWKPDEKAVRDFLPIIEAALPEIARPHWGKVFTMAPEVIAARYPRWQDFRELRARIDPQGRFMNPYLSRLQLDV